MYSYSLPAIIPFQKPYDSILKRIMCEHVEKWTIYDGCEGTAEQNFSCIKSQNALDLRFLKGVET